jgi:uncharacterized peroxidase-related enzyme
MSRIAIPTRENTPAAAQPLLDAVNKQLGTVPNLFKLTAASPAALEGLLSLSGALGKGTLDGRTREAIALTVAEHNGCDYCLAAHSYLGKNLAKMSDADIAAARDATAADARTQAVLTLARRITTERGRVSDADIASARSAGLSDAAILEVVANVAVNVFTNYLNNVAHTDVDFPRVSHFAG